MNFLKLATKDLSQKVKRKEVKMAGEIPRSVPESRQERSLPGKEPVLLSPDPSDAAALRQWMLRQSQPNQAEILDAAGRTNSKKMYVGYSSM